MIKPENFSNWFMILTEISGKDEKEMKRLCKTMRKDLLQMQRGEHILQYVRKIK